MDYSIFYKAKYDKASDFASNNEWDIFISAYNDSDRVKGIFNSLNCKEKYWIILPEYNYTASEIPSTDIVFNEPALKTESEIIIEFFDKYLKNKSKKKICIDITGFMRPHIIFLIRYLKILKLSKIDIIYTDPIAYVKAENTKFTTSEVNEIRQVHYCEGLHSTDISNDILIIGSGYDHKLISYVAEDKSHARKVQLFGFPSLQADMYQENIINAYKAEESIGGKMFIGDHNTLVAPANDPFITADIISRFVFKENKLKKINNLYLSPLSTKAQTLGFALFYIKECLSNAVSIIFPFCNLYTRETTKGIKKIWKYTIELDNF